MKNQYDRSSITGDEPATGIVQGREFFEPGLTIRQHFAAMAMQGILANEDLRTALLMDARTFKRDPNYSVAHEAVRQADLLIEELNEL